MTTMVLSLTLKGRSVVTGSSSEPQIWHFIGSSVFAGRATTPEDRGGRRSRFAHYLPQHLSRRGYGSAPRLPRQIRGSWAGTYHPDTLQLPHSSSRSPEPRLERSTAARAAYSRGRSRRSYVPERTA